MIRVARWAAAVCVGATAPLAAQDSLALPAFLAQVVANHPTAQQATLVRRQVAADLRAARGGFDPVVTAIWDLKRFNGVGYFDEFDARITVPTPWGLDFKVGWENAAGQIINPERKTPANGLLSAGVSLPIGARLLTDERRTALRQAELADDAAEAERLGAVGRLVQQAAREWGNWAEASARARIAAEGVTLAQFRLDATRRRVLAGDAAAIDSVEAAGEFERRQVQLIEAEAAAIGARLIAATFLWRADGAPDSLGAARQPGVAIPSALATGPAARRRLAAAHPLVAQARARALQAEAQRRLTATQVLPSASLDVASLAAGTDIEALRAGTGTDYKASLGVRAPLYGRREWARYRAAQDRARQLAWERDRLVRDVELAIERAEVELAAVERQAEGQRRVVAAAEAVLRAEQRRFDVGETSLLVVNLRERALLDERLREAQLVARRAQAIGALVAALGTPEVLRLVTDGRTSP
ncbi:MAG: TolC family protein [Gemmatimonadaceae bacterium]